MDGCKEGRKEGRPCCTGSTDILENKGRKETIFDMQCWYYHSVWSYSVFVGDWLPLNPRFSELFAVVWLSLVSFSDSSVGKESTCNAGDPSSIPGSGRSAGEGIGYPLQYSWAFLALQLIKNLSAMWETWVQSLGWENSLEKGKTIHSRILAWRISRTTVHGVTKSWTRLSNFHFTSLHLVVLVMSCDFQTEMF